MRAGFPGNREKLNRTIMETIQTKVNEPVSDELRLVQAAKKGDVGAFGELVKRYDRNVFHRAAHHAEPRGCGRRGPGRVPEGVREPGAVSGAEQVLHLAGADRGERGADEVAAPPS